MGQSRDAQRLQRLAGTRVHAAVLVDRPKGFGLPKDALLAAGADMASERFAQALRGRLADVDRDETIEAGLTNAAIVGVTSSDVLIASRGRLTGRPTELLRRDAISDVQVKWIDNEHDGLRSRLMLLEFRDRSWSILATPWKRLIPDDAIRVVQAFGRRARRASLHQAQPPHS